ncbi:MAG TPA: sugar transferase [Opitutaceae bacterium]
MLTHPRQTRVRFLQGCDGALFALSVGLAYALRARFPWLDLPELESFAKYALLFPAVAFLGPAVLASQGFYERPRLLSRLGVLLLLLRTAVFTIVGLILLLFLARVQYARSVVLLAGAFGSLFVYVRHELFRWFESTRLAQEQWRRCVLWVGTPEENARAQDSLSATECDAILPAGEFDPRTQSPAALEALLHDHAINAVVVSLNGLDTTHVAPVLAACEREGVEAIVRPGLFVTSSHRLALDALGGEPVLYFRAQAASPRHLFLKQALDYGLAAGLLVVLAPLLLAVALALKLTSPGPVLYRQARAGLNGRPFTLWKFRSMHPDAEHARAALAPRNEMRGPVFKVTNDPRVTPLGRWLRRHSLDELPQLWNVLHGEMSLVGPRPLPVEEVKRFEHDTHRRRLSVKPGLTCLWQIHGRNDIADFNDWVRLDLAYIDQWSLWLDLKILLATVPVALLGRGGR